MSFQEIFLVLDYWEFRTILYEQLISPLKTLETFKVHILFYFMFLYFSSFLFLRWTNAKKWDLASLTHLIIKNVQGKFYVKT